jgi:RHS repeat-associated protein
MIESTTKAWLHSIIMQILQSNPTKTPKYFSGDKTKLKFARPWNRTKYTYDENGNRETLVQNSTTYNYTVTTDTNRLASTTGPTAKSFSFDASGNVTGDGTHTYAYDDRGRLVDVDSGSVTYEHNGQGQRVKKDDGSNVTLFVYDEAGQLVGEYDGSGNAIQEHVWFNGMPVAVLAGSSLYYVHTDQLGTPRIVTDGNTAIWRWESGPFGEEAAQEDPDGDQTDFTYNLRFLGQYYDEETGFHYNYHRTYDPSTGRYYESDPIGLRAGPNTFAYVGNKPMSYSDPFGLDIVTTSRSPNPSTTGATPVCSKGDFGIKFFNRDPCTENCARKHEQYHIDRIRSKKPNICAGVTFSYFQYTGRDLAGLEEEEYAAYIQELKCLEDQTKTVCLSPKCQTNVLDRIQYIKERLGWL